MKITMRTSKTMKEYFDDFIVAKRLRDWQTKQFHLINHNLGQ